MKNDSIAELATRLRIGQTSDGGQRFQGSAVDVVSFLSLSGQPELEGVMIGAHTAMYHSGQRRLAVDLNGDSTALDQQQIKVEISKSRLVIERLASEATESSPGQPAAETLSDGGDHE